MIYNKKAFTFVELIISISILILLAIISVTTLNSNKQKTNNAKIDSDTITLKNAFVSYKTETKELPNPNGNNNYFTGDSSYTHKGLTDAFGIYGSVTENTISKKYIDNIPLDPVSNHYYSYGKTVNNKYFEIASIIRNDEISITKLDGNYPGEYGPISLIREYNGGFFISNKSQSHLPYNPDEHILTVTDDNRNIYRVGDTINTGDSEILNLYFSDGSVSTLQENSTLTLSELDFKTPEDNLTTKIKLFLGAGAIFTKATALNEDSSFKIYTSDTSAAVRGTVFLVEIIDGKTIVSVFYGEVEVSNDTSSVILGENQKVSLSDSTSSIPVTNPEVIIDQKDKIPHTPEPIEENLPIGKDCSIIGENLVCNGMDLACLATDANGDPIELDNGDSKDFYEKDEVIIGSETCSQQNFTCSNFQWENASVDKSDYTFESCTPRNGYDCTAKTSYIYGNHNYLSIPLVSHNTDSPLISLSGVIENNGTFDYELALHCFDLDYDTINENLISFICDPNFTQYTSTCVCEMIIHNEPHCEQVNSMNLYAYAPYNDIFNDYPEFLDTFLALYTESANIDGISNYDEYAGMNIENLNENAKKLISVDNYGLMVDSIDHAEYVKYSGLTLSGDFAIEMRVKFPSSNPGTTRYLFQLGDYKAYLFHDGKIFLQNDSDKIFPDITSYYDGGFHTITTIKQGSTYTLKIDGNDFGNFTSTNGIGSELFVGSKNDSTLQLNNIIDYVKIYK